MFAFTIRIYGLHLGSPTFKFASYQRVAMLPSLAEGSNYLRGLDLPVAILSEGYFFESEISKNVNVPHHVLSYKKTCKLIRTQSYHYWPVYYFARSSCFHSSGISLGGASLGLSVLDRNLWLKVKRGKNLKLKS